MGLTRASRANAGCTSPKLLVAAFCALLLMAEIPYPGSWGPVWFAESLTTAALTGIAIVAGHSRAPAVSLPWLAFLGRISYSTYLMHAMILDLFVLGGHRMTVGRTAIYLPIVLGVSISDASRAQILKRSDGKRT
jgi:peptidoglycan/LPS O-acetylase OafA/YrhL